MSDPPPILEARGLIVEYPGVRALDGVDFEVRAGEIHALLGENGAGKSTLINVLSGALRPGAGSTSLQGKPVRLSSPRQAERAGISTVRQEVDLIPTLGIAENIGLCRQPRRRWWWAGLIDHRAMRRRAEAALARLDLHLNVTQALNELPIATQQMVAIARAIDVQTKALILDEPTSSLDARETARLFQMMRRMRDQGMAIVFITHFIQQVYAVADRITVLRNGQRIGTWRADDLPRAALVQAMTGRSIEHAPIPRVAPTSVACHERLVVDRLGRRNVIAPVSLVVGVGQACGLAGLLGSGRSELARLIFGLDRCDSGMVRVDGCTVRCGSVRAAIAAGIAFTPEDRREALALDLSVRDNVALALQASRGAFRWLPRLQQQAVADRFIAVLGIRTPSAATPVRSLSGGNQQKVLLARWLAMRPRVMILDEPARGVDIGARADIERLIDDLRREDTAIVFISSEMDELARVCGKALVLRDRVAVGVVEPVDEATVLALIAGSAVAGATQARVAGEAVDADG